MIKLGKNKKPQLFLSKIKLGDKRKYQLPLNSNSSQILLQCSCLQCAYYVLSVLCKLVSHYLFTYFWTNEATVWCGFNLFMCSTCVYIKLN